MFRRMILSAILGTGLVAGLTMTPATAEAAVPYGFRHHRFEVMVLRGRCWECSGTYGNRWEAERAAEHFRCHGMRVEIRPI